MLNALGLLKRRRFLPLFTTQFLGAFNDNLFKTSMVLFATYAIFNDAHAEANFNALATGLSIVPFVCCRRCRDSWRTAMTRRGSSAS